MKNLTLIICLFIACASYGQRSSGLNGGSSGSGPSVSDEISGFVNGCNDGVSYAYNQASFDNALASILANSSISLAYKDAYTEAMYTCRAKVLRGEAIPSNLTDFAKCHLFNDQGACSRISGEVGFPEFN